MLGIAKGTSPLKAVEYVRAPSLTSSHQEGGQWNNHPVDMKQAQQASVSPSRSSPYHPQSILREKIEANYRRESSTSVPPQGAILTKQTDRLPRTVLEAVEAALVEEGVSETTSFLLASLLSCTEREGENVTIVASSGASGNDAVVCTPDERAWYSRFIRDLITRGAQLPGAIEGMQQQDRAASTRTIHLRDEVEKDIPTSTMMYTEAIRMSRNRAKEKLQQMPLEERGALPALETAYEDASRRFTVASQRIADREAALASLQTRYVQLGQQLRAIEGARCLEQLKFIKHTADIHSWMQEVGAINTVVNLNLSSPHPVLHTQIGRCRDSTSGTPASHLLSPFPAGASTTTHTHRLSGASTTITSGTNELPSKRVTGKGLLLYDGASSGSFGSDAQQPLPGVDDVRSGSPHHPTRLTPRGSLVRYGRSGSRTTDTKRLTRDASSCHPASASASASASRSLSCSAVVGGVFPSHANTVVEGSIPSFAEMTSTWTQQRTMCIVGRGTTPLERTGSLPNTGPATMVTRKGEVCTNDYASHSLHRSLTDHNERESGRDQPGSTCILMHGNRDNEIIQKATVILGERSTSTQSATPSAGVGAAGSTALPAAAAANSRVHHHVEGGLFSNTMVSAGEPALGSLATATTKSGIRSGTSAGISSPLRRLHTRMERHKRVSLVRPNEVMPSAVSVSGRSSSSTQRKSETGPVEISTPLVYHSLTSARRLHLAAERKGRTSNGRSSVAVRDSPVRTSSVAHATNETTQSILSKYLTSAHTNIIGDRHTTMTTTAAGAGSRERTSSRVYDVRSKSQSYEGSSAVRSSPLVSAVRAYSKPRN